MAALDVDIVECPSPVASPSAAAAAAAAVVVGGPRAPAIPFITGATSFTGCFLVAELMKKPLAEVPKVLLFVRAKDAAQAECRVRETVAKWFPPAAKTLDLSRCQYICGTDLVKTIKDVFKATTAATDSANKITDIFDFAMRVNYSTRYKDLHGEWAPIVKLVSSECIKSGVRYHYPGSLTRYTSSTIDKQHKIDSDLWRSGYGKFKQEMFEFLEGQRKKGLKLMYYDLPYVLGARGIRLCPDNYGQIMAMIEILKTQKIFPFLNNYVPADVLGEVMCENIWRQVPFLRPLCKTIFSHDNPAHLPWYLNEKIPKKYKDMFYIPGSTWNKLIVPDDMDRLVHAVDWTRVDANPPVIPDWDETNEFAESLNTIFECSYGTWIPEFAQAICKLRDNSEKSLSMDNSAKLILYGLWKQCTVGDAPDDVVAKAKGIEAKYKAESWFKRKGLTKEQAMHEYAVEVDKILAKGKK